MRPWMCSECARNQPPGRVVTRPPQSHSHFMATQLVTKWSPVQLQVALAAVPSQIASPWAYHSCPVQLLQLEGHQGGPNRTAGSQLAK